jgi:hypothetical protein
LQVYASRCSS